MSVVIVWVLAGLLTWSVAPTMSHCAAQESSPPSGNAAADTTSVPAAPPQAEQIVPQNPLVDLSGLFMQPVFLAVKVPVAVVGAIAGGLVWAANGGSTELAQTVWGPTVGGTWGWSDFVRSFGNPEAKAP